MDAVEASPDGTKLFVGGNFNTVSGQTRRDIVSLNPTTGALNTGFTANSDVKVGEHRRDQHHRLHGRHVPQHQRHAK